MKKAFKGVISLMLAVIVVAGVMMPIAPTVSAVEFDTRKGDSDMWLVDPNTKKTASTIYLYGRADYICLKLKKDSRYYARFYFEMYSDSKYKKEVASYSTYAEGGTSYVTLPISFDDLKNGTYYVKTYVYKETHIHYYDHIDTAIDPDTERTYKIVIKKSGTDIDEMNTVMYGYENTENGPRIYWYSVPGATGYYVYRKSPKTGKYSKIKTVKDSGDKFTAYTDKTYKGESVTRYYKVVAYKGSAKTPQSLEALKVVAYKAPTVKVEAISDNRLKVSWSKIKSGAEYTLYSRRADSASWTKVKTVDNKLTYTVDASKYDNNQTYYFTVIANVNGIYSAYNTKGVSFRLIKAPKLLVCTYPEDGGIAVNWESVAGADAYKIYRKGKSSADWVEIDEVTGNSTTQYVDSTANAKDYYYYTVRAMRKGVNGSLNKAGVQATILTQPVLTGITPIDGQSVRISWDKIENNCSYVVMEKTADGWNEIATTTNDYYNYNFYSWITSKTFTVKAERGAFESEFDNEGVKVDFYPTVIINDVEVSDVGVTLKWKKPANAEGCVVYRKADDGEYTAIAELDTVQYVDTDVEAGVNYTYKIAYKYNDVVIDEASIELPVYLNTDVVEREDAVYNTTSSYNYKTFKVKIKDYDASCSYFVYRQTEAGFVKYNSTINANGEILVEGNDLANVESFAIARVTPEGGYTYITAPDFTVEFVSDYIPAGVASGSVENGYPTIKWDYDSTKTAENIHIYRKAPDSKNTYKLIAVVPATETTFIDEAATQNYVCDYQLRVEKGGFVSYGGPVVQINFMGAPEFYDVHNYKGGTWLRWTEVSRASEYAVYKKLSSEEEWEKIGTTSNLYFDDEKDKKFVSVMYKVVAVDSNGNESPAGLLDEWYYVPSLSGLDVKNETKNNKLTWNPVDGADGYLIVYEDYNITKKKWSDKKTIKVSGGTKSGYTDKNIPANVLRRYRVNATYKGFDGVYSNDGGGYISTVPEITSIKSTNNGVKMKFSKVSGVSEYVVYRKTSSDGSWKKLETVSSRSFTDSTAKDGKKYYYTVKARFDKCGCPIYSKYNSKGWSITYKK